MTDLERLTLLMDEHAARAVRAGYALGFQHGDDCQEPDLPASAPEFRVLDSLEIRR